MAFSRLELKIISIIQLVMSVILFALGIDAMLDSSSCKYTCPRHRTTGVLLPTLIILTVKIGEIRSSWRRYKTPYIIA